MDFKAKIKILRDSYELSGQKFSELLMLKSGSTLITFWEKGKNYPSFEVLLQIAEIFGISLDWITGLSDVPYNIDVITKMENLYVEAALQGRDTGSKYCALQDFSEIIKKFYSTEKQREKYSLPVRANICYFLYCYVIFSGLLTLLQLDQEAYPVELGKAAKIDVQIQTLKQIKKLDNEKSRVADCITKLLLPNSKPFFDLTKI